MEPNETPAPSTASDTPPIDESGSVAPASQTEADQSSPVVADPVANGDNTTPDTPDSVEPAGDSAEPARVVDVGIEAIDDGSGIADQSGHAAITLSEPTVESVMMDIVSNPSSAAIVGYRANRPAPRLNDEQALLQAKIFDSLQRQGKTLNSQGDVYPWLLDQLIHSLA